MRWRCLFLICFTECSSDECAIYFRDATSFCQEDGICYSSTLTCSDAYLQIASARPLPPRADGLLHEPVIAYASLLSTPVGDSCDFWERFAISTEVSSLARIVRRFVNKFNTQAPRIIFFNDKLADVIGHVQRLEGIAQNGSPCSNEVLSQVSSNRHIDEFVRLVLDTAEVVMRLPFPHQGYIQHLIPYLYMAAELTFIAPVHGAPAQRFWPRNIDLVLTLSQMDPGGGWWRFRFARTEHAWESYTSERLLIPGLSNSLRVIQPVAGFQARLDLFTAEAELLETHVPTKLAEQWVNLLHDALGDREVENAMSAFCESNPGFIAEVWQSESSIHICARTRARAAMAYFCAESIELDDRVAFMISFGPTRNPTAVSGGVAISPPGSPDEKLFRIGSTPLLEFHTSFSRLIDLYQLNQLVAYIAQREIEGADDRKLLRGIGRVLALAFSNGIYHIHFGPPVDEKMSVLEFLFRKSQSIRKGFYDWYADGIVELTFSVTELGEISRIMYSRF
jgi:hypothetical protein